MATRTKPLISAAALASAAAVAVVSPGVAPTLNTPTPAALSRAAYQLTSLSDVLSIPAVAWTDLLFNNTGWGGVLGPENYGPDWAAPQDAFGQPSYVNPWASYCNNDCQLGGIGGAAYLFFDALINGGGEGYDNSDKWKIGFVNYFFEPNTVFQLGTGSSPTLQFVWGGLSASAWYAAQGTLGRLIPGATVPIAGAFWGTNNVSVFYNFGLSIAAVAIGAVPLVGPLVGNSILAYLGDLMLDPGTQQTYQYGLSGMLNYWVDLATQSVPPPTKVPWYRIDPATAASVTLAAAPVAEAESADAESADASESKSEGTEVEGTEVEGTEVEGVESHGAEVEGVESHGAEVEGTEVEDKAAEATVVEATKVEAPPVETPVAEPVAVPAADVAVNAPAEAPAAPKRPRPIRDALQNAGKQINQAVANAKAAKAERVAARKDKVKAGAAE